MALSNGCNHVTIVTKDIERLIDFYARNFDADRKPLDPRIRQAMDYIGRRLDQPLNVDTLARHCHISTSRFAHLFRQQVGVAPGRYLEQQRLSRACQLLELTAHSIGEIAGRVGYDDPFYFSQRFKKYSGSSPRAYRHKITKH